MKKFLSLLLAGALLLSMVPASLAEDAAADAKTTLVTSIGEETAAFVGNITFGDLAVYSDMDWKSRADTFPSKFDLRDRGVVPEIRSQGNWGTCWSFASIAACEISQLSTLGVTAEKFKELTGIDMDLSERHLAWFGTSHLPTLEQYAEGEYPYDKAQAGEGTWNIVEDTDPNSAHFQGGMLGYASSVFANGVGPETEEDWPYKANDGTSSTDENYLTADWSIPEEARYRLDMEMLNASILPSPAERDADGNYVYNEAGTEAIKQELLAGRGVSIMYHADQNMSVDTIYRAKRANYMEQGMSQDLAEIVAGLETHTLNPEDATPEQKKALMIHYLEKHGAAADEITDEAVEQAIEEHYTEYANEIANPSEDQQTQEQPEQQTEQAQELTEEEKAAQLELAREAMKQFGIDYDKLMTELALQAEANAGVYMNTETYAQYVDNEHARMDHGVTIVGWDDDYAVSNFLPDHQPPAPGAWIVRNSWGSEYGNDGYFYLSYYDRTINFVETFEFVADANAMSGVAIDTYDSMEASAVNSVKSEQTVSMANIFPLEMDAVLSYISVMTSDLNTQVTADVYLLNENYTSPTDGVLLETVTKDYEFAGYHRITLDYDYQLSSGAVISVVERQRVNTAEGTRYALPYTNGRGLVFAQNIGLTSWSVGVVNEGESFVSVDGQWYDWKNIVDEVKTTNAVASLAEFDNMNIKAYFYTLEGVQNAHSFREMKVYGDSDALICDDCGEMMIIVK